MTSRWMLKLSTTKKCDMSIDSASVDGSGTMDGDVDVSMRSTECDDRGDDAPEPTSFSA